MDVFINNFEKTLLFAVCETASKAGRANGIGCVKSVWRGSESNHCHRGMHQ